MDERIWTDRPLAPGEALERPDCRVAHVPSACQTLLTGDLDRAVAALAPGAPLLGLGGAAGDAPFAIRVARDHAILVTEIPPDIAAGWHGDGFAISRADGRFCCLSLSGPGAADVLAQGLSSPLPAGSPSAALRFAGRTALLTGREGGFGLWVERADLTFVSSFLRAIAAT
jgi:hypothetical protein